MLVSLSRHITHILRSFGVVIATLGISTVAVVSLEGNSTNSAESIGEDIEIEAYALSNKSPAEILEHYPERAQQLFSSLDTENPNLKSVFDAFNKDNPSLALSRFLKYIRNKKIPPQLIPPIPPPRKDLLELADDSLQRIFTIQSKTYQQPYGEDGYINWEDRGPNGDKEWAWMLNRHPHFVFLVMAYESTLNSRYLSTISDHLIDWIPNHAPPDRVSFSTSWRALEAARRIMDSWLAVYCYAKDQPALNDEALFLLLSSIPEHANYLREHHSFWGGNHKMTEKMAIAICGVVWPEFKQSRDWLKDALEVIQAELFKQTYPDGSYKELANHYQKVVATNYLRLLKLFEGNGIVEISPEFRQRVESVWDYFTYVSRPSGFGPLNSDSSREDNFTFITDANQFFQRNDWRYILTYGSQGHRPQNPPSRYFEWAGHAIMRDGWSQDSQWAFFDIGPHGSAHQHWDRLHLSISLGQHDVLVDSGRYIYKPGAMRNYFRYGVGHNVLRVDQTDSERPPNTITDSPLSVISSITDSIDTFGSEVFFDLDTPPFKSEQIKHRRIVTYLRSQGWLVIDEIVGYGSHLYDTYWNFHPECLVTKTNNTLDAELPNGRHVQLSLLNLEPSSNANWDLARGQIEPEIRGWYSWAYNERSPSTSARYRYTHHQPHLNIWWIREKKSSTISMIPILPIRDLKNLIFEISSPNKESKQILKWNDSESRFEIDQ